MTTDMESLLDGTPVGAADDQRINWDFRSWCDGLVGGASAEVRDVLEAIEDRWALDSGISRAAVIEVADGDPVRLLLSSMVWGFGTIPYGPARTSKMLGAPQLRETLADIAAAARTSAELGFSSLFRHGRSRVPELSIAMGSKFIYFAAGGLAATPGSPLVYDLNVYWSLKNIGGGWAEAPNPRKVMSSAMYAAYVSFVDDLANTRQRSRDDVEIALFGGSTWLRRQRRLDAIASR